jgi:hypothetical protein
VACDLQLSTEDLVEVFTKLKKEGKREQAGDLKEELLNVAKRSIPKPRTAHEKWLADLRISELHEMFDGPAPANSLFWTVQVPTVIKQPEESEDGKSEEANSC